MICSTFCVWVCFIYVKILYIFATSITFVTSFTSSTFPPMSYLLLILWIAFLIKGADYLVDGASSVAKKYGISSAIIGLTIVAFGTSLPELIVNILGALQWNSGIAFGNVIGSNIANILLVLWITGLITTLKVTKPTVRKEIPFSLLAVAVLAIFANINLIDGIAISTLMRSGGLILLMFFVIFLYYAYESAQQTPVWQDDESDIVLLPSWKSTLFIVWWLAALYIWGTRTVDGAIKIAQQFGLSDFLISVTVIAIGTSLPELVTSIVAARKNDVDLAVGNIVGSNIFNILWILGVTAVIRPLDFPQGANIDMAVLSIATILLFVFMFVGHKHQLQRWQSALFVVSYVAYIVFVIMRG